MGKKSKEEEEKVEEGKEWRNLLGSPSFKRLENGRFKCVQTGHEVPSHGKDSYAQTKHCRLGLIDSALSKNKAPLNMFHQDPLSRSKLICKLTGDIVNKSEEHIWKHIHGKRFLNELGQLSTSFLPKCKLMRTEKKEAEELTPNRKVEEPSEQAQEKISKPKAEGLKKKKKKKKKKPEQNVGELISEGDRWDSGSDSGLETEDAKGADAATEADKKVAGELSKRRKRKSKEIEASNIASTKKKKKKKKTKSA